MRMLTFHVMLLFALAPAARAAADPALDRIARRGQLSVCYGGLESPGFAYIGKDGKPAGLTWDLIVDLHRRFNALAGRQLALNLVRVTPVNRIVFVKQGRCDFLVTSLLDTPERRREIDFVSPGIYSAAAAVFAPKATRIERWDDLRGKTVCAPAASVWIRPYEQKGLRIAGYPGMAEVHKAVLDGRCVASLGDDTGYAKVRQDNQSWKGFEVKLIGDERLPWGVALRKDQPQLKRLLGGIVTGWHRDGVILALERKYGLPPNPWAQRMAREHALAVSAR